MKKIFGWVIGLLLVVFGIGACFGGEDEATVEEKPKTEVVKEHDAEEEVEKEAEEEVAVEEEKVEEKSEEEKKDEADRKVLEEDVRNLVNEKANPDNLAEISLKAYKMLSKTDLPNTEGQNGKHNAAYYVGKYFGEKMTKSQGKAMAKEMAEATLNGAIEKPQTEEIRLKQIAQGGALESAYEEGSELQKFGYRYYRLTRDRFLDRPKDESFNTGVEIAKEKATEIIIATATIGERNAAETAYSYLQMSGFSRKDLQGQLEYEKFTPSEVQFALKVIDGLADWNQEAAESAQSYMETSSMSAQELYEQLIFEGFTAEQASFGVKSVGY